MRNCNFDINQGIVTSTFLVEDTICRNSAVEDYVVSNQML